MTILFRGQVRRRIDRSRRGADGERIALGFLNAAGLGLLTRNYRCRLGELDLVMRDDECVVIVEVRSRMSGRFLEPWMTVDRAKQRRIERASAMFIAEHPEFGDAPLRFDVLGLEEGSDGPAGIQWIKDAFRP